MARILVVEDEPTVSDVVARYLRRDGHEVESAHDGTEGLRIALTRQLDLIVLDVMLPGLDGLEVCRRLRPVRQTPVIMLTARAEDGDAVLGLGLGADDYVRKPFSPLELMARVKAVLRRREVPTAGNVVDFGDVRIDAAARAVWRDDEAVELTATEFDLLWHMASRQGQVFSREQLLAGVWGYDYLGDAGTVTVHMRRLREKLERDPSAPRRLKTVWGVGYKFEGH